MTTLLPDYLNIPPQRLGEGTTVTVRILGDMASVAQNMAETMLEVFREAKQQGRAATLIIPVGPVDQFPILADLINRERFDCREVMLINMDEYLTPDDRWVDIDHPLSFRGYMNRKFYDLIDSALAPRPENRVFPDPQDPAGIRRAIDDRGGVDVCFGGIGINGHMAFNEPPEPGERVSADEFAALPSRMLDLSRETKTINSVTVGGELSIIPARAMTVGMKEILASRKCRFYCNRPWQSSVVRRVLHGPITSACPASLLRTHADASLTIADYVAALPDIRLR
ncbi:MAG: glucosamine-6-phosphate isomerase [Rhodopirellula sp.]|nr:glucosamine-6-phosphate isomerase [Rhodopirellula sp.]